MRFLVKGEWVETGAVLPAEQFAPLIEHVVLPSLEQWDQWEQQGKSTGGVLAGQRAGVFLIRGGVRRGGRSTPHEPAVLGLCQVGRDPFAVGPLDD